MPAGGSAIIEILIPILRLILLTLAGFFLFRIREVRERLLKPLVWLTLNIVFPLYFVHSLPSQWAGGREAGWAWAAIFFSAYLVFLGFQLVLAKLLINRVPLLRTKYPREFLVLFAMHNAGYVPLPIIAALAPEVVSLYLSFYLIPFIILFFTVGAWLIQGGAEKSGRFTINGPMVGIAVGLILAVSGVYSGLPAWVQAPFRFVSSFALDAVMIVLGAILGSIPAKAIKYRREFGGYILVKMILFPLAVFGLMLVLSFRNLSTEVSAGIKLAMLVEAVAPPATNIMVLTKAYGTDDQLEYAGSAIIYSYLAAVVIMPIFLVLAELFFT